MNVLLAAILAIHITAMSSEKVALIFGGNGFMGSETVTTLLPHFDQVIVVNRGNWYYDSNSRIMGRKGVHHIKCNRFRSKHENNLLKCVDFVKMTEKIRKVNVVVDFSAYKPKAIEDAVEALQDKIGLYIYISTDSVYEVCEGYDTGTEPARETDAVRPKDPEKRRLLRRRDSYGDEKLSGEEVLVASNVPYVVLRLPDVLGPRDTTHRWWTYQLWVQYFKMIGRPIPIPESGRELKTSYIYSKDVATTVLNVIALSGKKPEILNQAYNIGFDKGLTLLDLLKDLIEELGQSNVVTFEQNASEDAFTLFPSVTRGMVNIEKAKAMLGFEPTPWKQALKETAAFYQTGLIAYPTERDQCIETLLENVIPEERKDEFVDFINEITASELTTAEPSTNNHSLQHDDL